VERKQFAISYISFVLLTAGLFRFETVALVVAIIARQIKSLFRQIVNFVGQA
jgi:hypothetical protein